MSLTSHLDQKDSRVSRFVDSCSPLVVQASGSSRDALKAKSLLRIDDVNNQQLLVPLREGANPGTVGTAFDYRVRFALAPVNVSSLVAVYGVELLKHFWHGEFSFAATASVNMLRQLEAWLDRCKPYQEPLTYEDELTLDRYCVALALLEAIYRAGPSALSGSLGEALRSVRDPAALLTAVGEANATNVGDLVQMSNGVINSWRTRRISGEMYLANPTFPGSGAVGGADADFVLGGELVELKTTSKLTAADLRKALRQLLGYVLLDFDDAYAIRRLTVYNPRFAYQRTWSVEALISQNDPSEGEKRLVELRAEMRAICDDLLASTLERIGNRSRNLSHTAVPRQQSRAYPVGRPQSPVLAEAHNPPPTSQAAPSAGASKGQGPRGLLQAMRKYLKRQRLQ